MTDDSPGNSGNNTDRHMDKTIRELAERLDDIIEADDEGVWINPKGEEQPWTPYSGDDIGTDQFVAGKTGIGKTTLMVNWWRQIRDDNDVHERGGP